MTFVSKLHYTKEDKILSITFASGAQFDLPAEYLRVESPSAEVQGHDPSQKVTVAGKYHVGISAIHPVGNYAIRIEFDDTHATGIFSWVYLLELCQEYDAKWNAYLMALQTKGLSR